MATWRNSSNALSSIQVNNFDSGSYSSGAELVVLGFDEDDADLYLSQIRYDKNGKYDPNLIIKVPFSKNKYDVDIVQHYHKLSLIMVYL